MTPPPISGADIADVDKPSVYEENGTWVYRASALMNCQNALLAARLGLTGSSPPDDMQARYDEGHRQEPVILKQLDDEFGFANYAHQQTMEMKVGASLIRGHIDSLSLMDRDTVLTSYHFAVGEEPNTNLTGKIVTVDAKALAQGGFDLWVAHGFEKFLYYLWQQAVYDYAGMEDGVVMAVKNKVTGELRADYYSHRWFAQRLPKSTIIGRVLNVEKDARLGPAALFANQCSPKMFPCPFWQLHPTEGPPIEGAMGSMEDLVELAEQVTVATSMKVAAETEEKRLKADIAKFVGDKKTTTQLDGWTVSTYYGTSGGVDWPKLAAALNVTEEDARKTYSTKSTNKALTVKVTPRKVAQ